MDDPWIPFTQRANRFVTQDHQLGKEMAELSKRSSYEQKLATALEEGRIYGLRQANFDMILRKQLNRICRRSPTEKMW